MDELNKTFLITLVNFDAKLRANDVGVMAEVAFLKSFTMSDDQKLQVFDILSNVIEDATGTNNALIQSVIAELDIPDKDYLIQTMKLPDQIDGSNMGYAKSCLNDIFSTNIVISSPQREFTFYSKCVYIAIVTKDNALIEKAIQKVQSL